MACKLPKPGLWMWRNTSSENIHTRVTDHRFCRTGYESALTDAPSQRPSLLLLVLDIVCTLSMLLREAIVSPCLGCTCSSNAGAEALHAAELLARSTCDAAELPPCGLRCPSPAECRRGYLGRTGRATSLQM